MANNAAYLARADRSAPVNPARGWVFKKRCRGRLGPPGTFCRHTYRIRSLSWAEGKGTYNSLSNLPGLSIAASIMSGLLVAANKKTKPLPMTPSISVRN